MTTPPAMAVPPRPATARLPNVLAVAGSDPSGGAGIQADLKTFAALGCYGMAAVTALTAQNTVSVEAVHVPPSAFVAQQVAAVFADIEVAAVKIGMLGSAEIAAAVATVLRAQRRSRVLPIVLDPVLVATSGAALGDEAVVEAIRSELVPLATLVTPNLHEAARLAGLPQVPKEAAEIEAVARGLRGAGGAAWLIKGGHGTGPSAEDYLLAGDIRRWYSAPRVATRNTHGTGCTLSSAIAALLAQGRTLEAAVGEAKTYLGTALAGADRLDVGHGPGPLHHFAAIDR